MPPPSPPHAKRHDSHKACATPSSQTIEPLAPPHPACASHTHRTRNSHTLASKGPVYAHGALPAEPCPRRPAIGPAPMKARAAPAPCAHRTARPWRWPAGFQLWSGGTAQYGARLARRWCALPTTRVTYPRPTRRRLQCSRARHTRANGGGSEVCPVRSSIFMLSSFALLGVLPVFSHTARPTVRNARSQL